MIVHCRPLILVVSMLLSQCLRADEPVIWGYAQFPPYIYTLPNDQPAGPFADIVASTFKHAKIEFQPLYTPNKRTRQAINNGLTDFGIGPASVLENPQDFYFSNQVVAKIDMRVYWIADQKPVTEVTGFNNSSVILITSFQYSGLRQYIEDPRNNVELTVNVEDHRRALSALSLNRATYMLGYHAPVELMQLEMNVANLNSYPLKQADIYMFINKSVKNSRLIMNKIDAAYAELYPKQKLY